MTTTKTMSISAQIPVTLGRKLNKIASLEERSKSFYIKKSLEYFLDEKMQDLEDYIEGNKIYEDFVKSGKKGIPFEKVLSENNV